MARSIRLAIAPASLLLLAGCMPAAPPPATPEPSPSPTPSFDLDLEAESALIASDRPGEWTVIGLARAGTTDVDDPRLSIVLRDEAGQVLDRHVVEIPLAPLPAAAAWPFRETFTLSSTPSTVETRLQGNNGVSATRPSVQGRVLRTFLDAQGRTVALGSLSNPAARTVLVDDVWLVARDDRGSMREVLPVIPSTARLEAGEVIPFLAPLPPGGETLDWEAVSIAGYGDGSSSGIDVLDVISTEDGQGHPFVTAVLRNNSQEPRAARFTAVVQQGSTWLVGDALEPPIVMAPGERAPVSIRLPGLGLPQEAEIEWVLVTDSTPAAGRPIPIASEVIDYQPLGSTLLLRVRLTAGREAVRDPAAYASLIGEEGRTVSAAWGAGPPILTPGETIVIPLALPLPRDFDLTLGQLDVGAAGLP